MPRRCPRWCSSPPSTAASQWPAATPHASRRVRRCHPGNRRWTREQPFRPTRLLRPSCTDELGTPRCLRRSWIGHSFSRTLRRSPPSWLRHGERRPKGKGKQSRHESSTTPSVLPDRLPPAHITTACQPSRGDAAPTESMAAFELRDTRGVVDRSW